MMGSLVDDGKTNEHVMMIRMNTDLFGYHEQGNEHAFMMML